MVDFLFHKISSEEKEKIKEEAKEIMDTFSKKLLLIKDIKLEDSQDDKDFEREELSLEKDRNEERNKIGENDSEKNEFSKEIMFENAPKKNKRFIIGDKKRW